MSRLFDAYRAFHQQGFVPIFAPDEFDPKMLVKACVAAGAKGIEYTLRRLDANSMIPWIRENYPELYLLIGSTVDDDRIVNHARKRYPQLLTFAELDAMDIDGFVSMLPFDKETIKTYSPRRLVVPSAYTLSEAYFQMRSGAHFAKMLGPGLELMKHCRKTPTYDFCPIMATGGMTIQLIPEAVAAGAVVLGAGFDTMLAGQPADISVKKATGIIADYIRVTNEARAKRWPEMMRAVDADRQTWLNSLPHYHPF